MSPAIKSTLFATENICRGDWPVARQQHNKSLLAGDFNPRWSNKMQLPEPEEPKSDKPQPSRSVDLRALGISKAQAAELRWRLQCFAEDWDDPAMDIYDDYDNALKALKGDGE
ncbi:MAG: hypothetical protein H7175_17450 [Burkholderiales bacterium]|nr:hypothetical protein [Anaerolineae bacterium]